MTKHLLETFELDASGELKKNEPGHERKLAVVTAFMHDPDILVLDEPTSGLDPIMQERFIKFIRRKSDGANLFCCPATFSAKWTRPVTGSPSSRTACWYPPSWLTSPDTTKKKVFKVEFDDAGEYGRFVSRTALHLCAERPEQNQAKDRGEGRGHSSFFDEMSQYRLTFISEIKFTLEDYFYELLRPAEIRRRRKGR